MQKDSRPWGFSVTKKSEKASDHDGQDQTQGNGHDETAAKGKKQRPKSIDEALRVLDEALAGPATEIREIVTDELSSLNATIQSTIGTIRSATSQTNLGETAGKVGDVVSEMTQTLKSSVETGFESLRTEFTKVAADSAETITKLAEDTAAQGVEFAQDIYKKADAEVRANPWPYIGGIAVGTFALGALWGAMNSNERD